MTTLEWTMRTHFGVIIVFLFSELLEILKEQIQPDWNSILVGECVARSKHRIENLI